MVHSQLMAANFSYSEEAYTVIEELAAALGFEANSRTVFDDIDSYTMMAYTDYGGNFFLADPVLTDLGYCYAVNNLNASQLLSGNTTFLRTFGLLHNMLDMEGIMMNEGWGENFAASHT